MTVHDLIEALREVQAEGYGHARVHIEEEGLGYFGDLLRVDTLSADPEPALCLLGAPLPGERMTAFDALDGFGFVRSSDDLKQELELTCNRCTGVLCVAKDGDSLAAIARVAADHECVLAACDYCQHEVALVSGEWVAIGATGDDSIWRHCCPDNHTALDAPHEGGMGA